MSILAEIIENKKRELIEAKKKRPLRELKKEISIKEKGKFLDCLQAFELEVKIIAEIKRRSPSKGEILPPPKDILEIARLYQSNAAVALSVLTERDYFGGSIEDLNLLKKNINLPILRKDFIIDEYQIYESKYFNADAILLIVRILDELELKNFSALAEELGLDVLFEVHNSQELDKVLSLSPKMIGINNRNLDSFQIDLNISAKLLPQVPQGIFKISESGIKSYQDIIYLKSLGAEAFLIGESILTADNPAEQLRTLLGYGQG